jgi:MoaA/NifB/PqqE/SkfB family radical SAM enzyme
MQPLPSTFCPAKWDEISFNFNYDYVYSCCKAMPVKYKDGDYNLVLDQQKDNLLNGVQDASCNFCWKVENQNLPSKRHELIKIFDVTRFNLYKTKKVQPTLIELYLGNECNFQCTYCNPKYSSQWELDVKKKPYKLFTDKHFYELDIKNQNLDTKVLDVVSKLGPDARLCILGGEPLLNKLFWKVLDKTNVEDFALTTNLSCKLRDLIKLKEKSKKFKRIFINVSLDSTGANAEFTRYGMNFNLFENNLKYLLDNAPENMSININSLMTSVTVHDLDNFFNFVKGKKLKYEQLTCKMFTCLHPRIQSFETLPDRYRPSMIEKIQEMKSCTYFSGLDMVESYLISSKFNKTLYQEFKYFLNEYADRKKIKIPICLN